MDETTAAWTLWAATARLQPAPGGLPASKTVVREARKALAEFLMTDHSTGFPPPVEPTPADRQGEAWSECAAVVREAKGASDRPGYALLCEGIRQADNGVLPKDGHGLRWPGASPSAEAVIGPMEDAAGTEVMGWTPLDGICCAKVAAWLTASRGGVRGRD